MRPFLKPGEALRGLYGLTAECPPAGPAWGPCPLGSGGSSPLPVLSFPGCPSSGDFSLRDQRAGSCWPRLPESLSPSVSNALASPCSCWLAQREAHLVDVAECSTEVRAFFTFASPPGAPAPRVTAVLLLRFRDWFPWPLSTSWGALASVVKFLFRFAVFLALWDASCLLLIQASLLRVCGFW